MSTFHRRTGRRPAAVVIALVGLSAGLLGTAPAAAEETEFEGTVGVLYRSVSVDGSERKYDEDFDGLTTGGELEELDLNWIRFDSGVADHARVSLYGLGGNPYQRAALEIGRQDGYDLRFRRTSQDYRYNLFELIGDEDGHSWATTSERTSLDLDIPVNDRVDLWFGFREHRREGESLFMKDFSRDLYLTETPIDRATRQYGVGADLRFGVVDVVVRQNFRRFDNRFDNGVERDTGLAQPPGNLTELTFYDWMESTDGSANLTTLRVHAPIGRRLDLDVGLYGTLLGDEEIDSDVSLNAEGTAFDGTPLSIVDGFSRADLDRDTLLAEVDLGIRIVDPVVLRLQYRTLEQDTSGRHEFDLEGTGASTTEDIRVDWSVDTLTAVLDVRPVRGLTFRVGARSIDRSLDRDGYGGGDPGDPRNADFESDGDETLVFAVSWRATDWLRLSADHEEGDIDRAFTSISPTEKSHTRVRARIAPRDDLRIGATWTDYEYDKPTATFAASSSGTTWSVDLAHQATDRVDYAVRYARQEVDSTADVIYDGAGFGGPAALITDAISVYTTDNDVLSARIGFRVGDAWRVFVRGTALSADGANVSNGTDVNATPAVPSRKPIVQDWTDLEIGVRHDFDSGLYVGGSVRSFDYDDDNDLLDYDGEMLHLRAGVRF